MNVAAIFGGTGFIGTYFALELLQSKNYSKVYLFDIAPVCEKRFLPLLKPFLDNGKIIYQYCDVRKPITEQIDNKESNLNLIANFAAIHREPGHEPEEYYETNLLGAENVCEWANNVSCKDIIFTSSIAPYGPSETPKTENSIPVPISAYGGSKLAAEKIHITWQHEDKANKRLTIVRPGVVFGAGEGGNVSRLIKAVLGRYFFYMANKNTRKAGTYVKELCRAMLWVHDSTEDKNNVRLFNMSMNPGPSVEEYVNTICEVAGIKRFVPSVPYALLYPASFVVDALARLLKINQPISPVRIRKLVKSNHILPEYLEKQGYPYRYTLKSALEDWKEQMPSEW
ncbi:NAD(P)-dependent oxidoreductase [Salinisphaera sp. G21_0]|uniref:NAD-dependent epimerase/dehydratase family protein n=1 Tax=Salinisphaera sp. G21_0 TaxID=2821094 RepID=UPI001ADB29DF|nr:NAD(P)-dependent oxidoreductase [Salinisphaera sp. G21_0]MBO9483089.1 NAD(P)-dependent oxidoreductase [Salinisphaera sp. G21_0]